MASKVASKASKPASKAAAKTSEGRSHKTKRSYESFRSYVEKTLKQVHPETGMSNNTVRIMDALVHWLVERIVAEVNTLLQQTRMHTVTSRDIQTAVRLMFPGELAKHAVSEGTKAVTKYNASQSLVGRAAEKTEKTHMSSANHAGLIFNPARFTRMLRAQVAGGPRIGRGAPIYLAAVAQYLVMEVLELAGNATKGLHVKRIIPRHIQLAVRGDEELDFLLKVTIPGGGVLPHIHKSLFKSGKKKQQEEAQA